MSELNITSQHILKIAHPIKEIRQRALSSLFSKLEYGFKFDDELNRSKELLGLLLKWFEFNDHECKEKALKIILLIFKSSSGAILIRHIGLQMILKDLAKIKSKVDFQCSHIYQDIISYIETKNTTRDEGSLHIPNLEIPPSIESEVVEREFTGDDSSPKSFHIDNGIFRDGVDANYNQAYSLYDGTKSFDLSSQGIKIYLLPWCHLCETDANTISMIEDALGSAHSVERTVNFLNDVLLKDFPPELFLSRPKIVEHLHKMLNNLETCVLSMEALFALCCALNVRIHQLYDPDLRHCKKSNYHEVNYSSNHASHATLAHLLIPGADTCEPTINCGEALNQMPLPVFCLDTIYLVINCLGQGTSMSEQKDTMFSMKEMNIALTLCFEAGKVLQKILTNDLWKDHQSNKFTQKIAQKIIIVLRTLGDILNRYRISFTTCEMADPSYRITYLRLLSFATMLAKWCSNTTVVPSTFTSCLYDSLADVSCLLLYPELHRTLKDLIVIFEVGSFQDQKKFSMFLDTEKICRAMSISVNLLQNYDEISLSSKVIKILRDSLPALEFHQNTNFFNYVIHIFCLKMLKWNLTPSIMNDVRYIMLTLMAHHLEWVQETVYSAIHEVVIKVIGGIIQTKDSSAIRDEASLTFLLHSSILIEICSQGLESESKEINGFAKGIVQLLLKGKLLMSDKGWEMLLEAIIPTLPYLTTHAAYDDDFGQLVIKTLDLNIGQCMLIPKIDMIMGNVRLLFTRCFAAQMEGSLNLTKFLNLQEDSDNLLPKHDCIRPDIICSMARSITPNNFNIKHGGPSFYEKGAMLQVMSLLKVSKFFATGEWQRLGADGAGDAPDVDPSFRRSALAQLAVMLQQPTLHETFLSNDGCNIITHYLRASLTTFEYTCFPESAMSCVLILNSLCYNNASIRQWASQQHDIVFNVLRALCLFPNEESFSVSVSQLLCLLAFSQVTINLCTVKETDDDISSDLSLPHCIVKRTNFPFKCNSYCQFSPHRTKGQDKSELLLSDPWISNYLRVYWCYEWYGGIDKITRWPYVPEHSNTIKHGFSPSLMMTSADLSILKGSCPVQGCVSALYQIQNATSHKAVSKALDILNGYLLLACDSRQGMSGVDALPWASTFSRFISSSPASPKDSSLLLNVTQCLSTFLKSLIKNGCNNYSSAAWIIESIMDSSRGITSVLKHSNSDSNWMDSLDQTPNRLRQNIIDLISNCCMFFQRKTEFTSENSNTAWGPLIDHLNYCLREVDIYDYYSLAYVGQMVKCLSQLTFISNNKPCKESQNTLIKHMGRIVCASFVADSYSGYKGLALVQNCFIVLCHLLENSLGDQEITQVWLENALSYPEIDNILSACLLWYNSRHLMVRCLSFKLLSGLSTQPAIVINLREKFEDSDNNIMEMVLYKVIDLTEASLFREQAAILLSNLLLSKNVRSNGQHLLNLDFYEKISATVTKVCLNELKEFQAGDNISLDILSNRDKLEVAHSKNELSIPIKLVVNSTPKCSVRLLTALTDVLFNILLFSDEIPEDMEKSGVFRILFRCIALKLENDEAKIVMIATICRTLHKAVNMSSAVQELLVNTEDCISALLNVFRPDHAVSGFSWPNEEKALQEMWKWAFLLIGSLSEIRTGFLCTWRLLSESGMLSFFEILLLSFSDQHYKEVCSSAIFCLVNLLSGSVKYTEDNKSDNMKSLLDKTLTTSLCDGQGMTPAPYKNDHHMEGILKNNVKNDLLFKKINKFENDLNIPISIDSVLSEDLCCALMYLYKTFNIGKDINSATVKDNVCCSVISGLCGLFAVSEAAKLYALNNGFIQDQIELMIEIQYTMAVDIKALDLIQRKGNHPLLNCLDWTVQLLCNIMTNCSVAKELCVSNNLIVPLNKMWHWCISTSEIRCHTIQMLCVYTNDCPKANQSMHITVGVRSILIEIIDLIGKEMNLVSRKHSLTILRDCLIVLENVSSHVHCRAVILKSEIFTHLNKLHPAITKRQGQWKEVELMWESFISTISRYPEGQLKVAEYMGVLCALVHQANGLMLSGLRNCSFNPLNRPRLLGSAELLNLFSTILTTETLLSDKLMVCAALWALGANHHKSKLSLRTAGLTIKLTDFLHRLKYTTNGSAESDRAIQIVTYVTKAITIA